MVAKCLVKFLLRTAFPILLQRVGNILLPMRKEASRSGQCNLVLYLGLTLVDHDARDNGKRSSMYKYEAVFLSNVDTSSG